jgi:FlaA1/EpsC-like NDP-sugar epimerase
MFKNRNVLVTGCGSLGRELVAQLLENGAYVTCVDNSELAFSRLKSTDRIHTVLADVTNYGEIETVVAQAEYVIHTAAQKYVDYVENNPYEAIRTNIDGTMNIIKACFKNSATKKMLNVSSDKICCAVSIYGLTKAITERLMLWADRTNETKMFSTIRHPNFMPSDGSCFSIWQKQKQEGKPITITDSRMTRWFIPIKEAATLTLQALELAEGGEIFIPASAKLYRIMDLAKEYGDLFNFVGMRQGERLHEQLMTADETQKANKCGKLWRLVP